MLRDLSPRKVEKKITGKGEAIAVPIRIGTDSQITGEGFLVLKDEGGFINEDYKICNLTLEVDFRTIRYFRG